MTTPPEDDGLDTSVADETQLSLRRLRGQLAAMRRALEASMDAEGGMRWEDEIAAPETPEPEEDETEAPLLKTPAQQAREERWRAEFRRNWPDDKPRRK